MLAKTAIAAAISAPLLTATSLAALAGAIATAPDATNSPICTADANTKPAATSTLSTAQRDNARIITRVGISMGVQMPGETIAIATALQESGLQNLGYGDRDSLGLFQQRPSQGWGTPAQIMNPAYAATQFYQHLLQVPGWRTMPTTQAAQAVQRSGFPDAYAKWEHQAQALATEFTGTIACTPAGVAGSAVAAAAVNAAHYRIPPGTPPAIVTVITFALAQLGKPYVFGATGPNAWDCSGLVQGAYARIGVSLPRTTYQQVASGTPVSNLAQMQPGDLLFIPGTDGTPQAPGHVGMYLGDKLLIQAPSSHDVVKISPLDQWATSISAVRHVV